MTFSTLERPRIIPGPRELLPVISRQFAMYNFFLNQLDVLSDRYIQHGDLNAVVAMPEGQRTMLFAFGGTYNKQVLSNPDVFYSVTTEKLKDNAFARLNSGLVNMNGIRHKQQRRLVMPAFHKQTIASYTEDMAQIVDRFLDEWKIGQTILTAQEMNHLVSRIIAHALFGFNDPQEGELRGLVLRDWVNVVGNTLNVLMPYRISPIKAKSENAEQMILSIIDEKRANPGNDVISLLLAARDESLICTIGTKHPLRNFFTKLRIHELLQ